MDAWSDASSEGRPRKSNYRVRFRHGVYPNEENQATRQDVKKYDYFFGGGQVWLGTPGKIDFVNEFEQVAENSDCSSRANSTSIRKKTAELLTRPRTTGRSPRSSTRATRRSLDSSVPYTIRNPMRQATIPPSSISSKVDFGNITSQPRRYTSPRPDSVSSFEGSYPSSWCDDVPSPNFWPADQDTLTTWTLEDPIEAQLFRFWIDQVAGWLDVTSPHNVFKGMVPGMALRNTMLLNAVLLISAQHIQRFDAQIPARPFVYHERLLQSLIPYLAEKGRICDEATLVAAMLLRCFEEHHAGSETQQHLSSVELFRGPAGWYFDMTSPVVQACLMIHAHFEIYHGMLDHSPIRIDFQGELLPALPLSSHDVVWRNQIVWICGRILQWAQEGQMSIELWKELTTSVERWESQRPTSFDALFHRPEGDATRYFPDIWFTESCHADAFQHLRICRFMLAMHRPESGTSYLFPDVFETSIQDETLRGLKEMIAVARCNKFSLSARVIAAHAVHAFGTVLEEDLDRDKMIEFLEEVNAMGWPCRTSIEWLRRHWHRSPWQNIDQS